MDRHRRRFLRIAGATAIAGALPLVSGPRLASAATADKFTPDVEIELVAQPDEVRLLPGQATAVWRYAGRLLKGPAGTLQPISESYAGPILRFRTGQKVRIRYLNRIPQPSIVHWHGLLVPERMDGHPREVVSTGGEYLYEFEVRNRAGTYWFHPHPHGHTGNQVYSGLAGLFLISDDEERAARLPDGERDLSIVLADRTFDSANGSSPTAVRRSRSRPRPAPTACGFSTARTRASTALCDRIASRCWPSPPTAAFSRRP